MKKRSEDERDAFVRRNWGKMSRAEMARHLGCGIATIGYIKQQLGLPDLKGGVKPRVPREKQTSVEDDSKILRETAQRRSDSKKYKEALVAIERLTREVEAINELRNSQESFSIKPSEGTGTSEATAVMVASDWHVEEIVDPATVQGLNKFNPDIAKARAELFFQRGLRLIRKEEQDVKINTVILALLGDFITNDIHEEMRETAAMRPMEAALFAKTLLQSGIEFLLNNTTHTIVIPCSTGNHGRTTQRVFISTEFGHSIEYFMYNVLADVFKNEPRVKFIIGKGYHQILDVYGQKVRFHHGHAVRFFGGVGGITIAVNKAIAAWNRQQQTYLDVFGHFHQMFDGGKFIANGSMIGWNAYANFIKAEMESPRQAFFLLDKKRGKTVTAPILFN